MYKHIKILEKYISASERNKSSHWKLFLNNKKVENIYVNLGFGSFEKKKQYTSDFSLYFI